MLVPIFVMCPWPENLLSAVILGSIVTNIYPVRTTLDTSPRRAYSELERRLDQWYIGLPEGLHYDASSRRTTPPPHILFLHVRYWGSVLLLNRAL